MSFWPVDIVLVRHAGCPRMNSVLLGRSIDGPLDERGERQARFVAQRLVKLPQLIVESSPRRRARHTAGIIASARDTTGRQPAIASATCRSAYWRTFASWSRRSTERPS